VTGCGGLDNSMCNTVLDLLKAHYLRLGEIVIEHSNQVIKFRVDDRGGSGSGGGCFGTEVRKDAMKLTNMIVAGFGGREMRSDQICSHSGRDLLNGILKVTNA